MKKCYICGGRLLYFKTILQGPTVICPTCEPRLFKIIKALVPIGGVTILDEGGGEK